MIFSVVPCIQNVFGAEFVVIDSFIDLCGFTYVAVVNGPSLPGSDKKNTGVSKCLSLHIFNLPGLFTQQHTSWMN